MPGGFVRSRSSSEQKNGMGGEMEMGREGIYVVNEG
jgi:hypothetical protein